MTKAKIVLVVAGGKGERMQTDIPKQFIEIQGKPILMHTLEVFLQYDAEINFILVLPAIQIDFWKSLCKKYAFHVPLKIVAGGSTRFQSVKNGLDSIDIPALIAVHDGVRPLVSVDTIARCFEKADAFGAAIPVVDSVDSIRQLTSDGSLSVDRSLFKLVQTPQVFNSEILKKAYEQDFSVLFTDDASVVEFNGINIQLVEGNRENIKITTTFDLELVEFLLR